MDTKRSASRVDTHSEGSGRSNQEVKRKKTSFGKKTFQVVRSYFGSNLQPKRHLSHHTFTNRPSADRIEGMQDLGFEWGFVAILAAFMLVALAVYMAKGCKNLSSDSEEVVEHVQRMERFYWYSSLPASCGGPLPQLFLRE